MRRIEAAIERVSAQAFTVPTEQAESDGTFEWTRTTLVLARARAGDHEGLGYTYAHRAAGELIAGPLARAVVGGDAMDTASAYSAMGRALRNIGRPGLGWEALSAVDVALWDLKARLLGVSLLDLLGAAREALPVYASGGFTSYNEGELVDEAHAWLAQGFTRVKIKVGRRPAEDHHRAALVRAALGPEVDLFVDANGAWSRKQALEQLAILADLDVRWAEEPVSSDDLEGLRMIRERAPAAVEIAAGEYGYTIVDFRRMIEAGAVDVLMADGTRCGGVTGLLTVAGLAEAHGVPLSTHCAPLLHAHVGAALRGVRHGEYFHDHARVEQLLFSGATRPAGGVLPVERGRPGLGVTLRERDAVRFAG